MNHHPGLCDAQAANALHPPEPAPRRFFYARLALAAAGVLLAALVLTGCDSAAAVSVAAQEADSRRDIAARAMCGPGAVVQWLDASTAECIKEAGHAARP